MRSGPWTSSCAPSRAVPARNWRWTCRWGPSGGLRRVGADRRLRPGSHLGAPPDGFMLKGQDWSLPPLGLRVADARPRVLDSCLRTVMRHCGLVRLDHIMWLHRQFFVPEGREPKAGTYVRLPSEELYALVSLEAWRAGTSSSARTSGPCRERAPGDDGARRAEDLRPAGRETPAPADGRPLPGADSLAMLGTHDMPTFAAFWETRPAAGGAGGPSAAPETPRSANVATRYAALARAVGERRSPAKAGGPGRRRRAGGLRVTLLAESPAPSVIVNLEDLWLGGMTAERARQRDPWPTGGGGRACRSRTGRRGCRVGAGGPGSRRREEAA